MSVASMKYGAALLAAASLSIAGSAPANAAILFANSLNPSNGNCLFQCGSAIKAQPYTIYAADNFILQQNSLVTGFTFDGTGNPGSAITSQNVTIDWQIYSAASGFLNSGSTPSSIGTLLFSGQSITTPSGNAGGGYVRFAGTLPTLDLGAGQYWLALHVAQTTPQWSGSIDDNFDPSVLYWGFGNGDGVWASNVTSNAPDLWTNLNPSLTRGGWAFSITGNIKVPEPMTGSILVAGSTIILATRRRKVARMRG